MKLSQIEKRIPQTLTNSKDIIQTDREYARRSSRARSTRGQENEAWALYKKFHPGSPEVTFLGTNTSFAQSHPPSLSLFRFHLSPFPQKRLILRLYFYPIQTLYFYWNRTVVLSQSLGYLWVRSDTRYAV